MKMTREAMTRRMSLRIPDMVRTTAEVLPIYSAKRVSKARQQRRGWRSSRGFTYQEDHRDVEQEGDEGVGKEREDADAVDIGHAHARDLNKQGDHAVDDSTSRGVVVEGNEGVHLELGGAQHALDHDETQSLEDDTTALVYNTQTRTSQQEAHGDRSQPSQRETTITYK